MICCLLRMMETGCSAMNVMVQNTWHAGVSCMSLTAPINAHCAGMGRRGCKREEYVFYYNYVTRFSALFHVFIVTMSQENGIGPSKGVQNTHQKRSVEGLWAKCQSVQ